MLEGAFNGGASPDRSGESRDPYRGISLWGSAIAAFAKQRPGILGPGLRQAFAGTAETDETTKRDGTTVT
jgi:hypothetical protein